MEKIITQSFERFKATFLRFFLVYILSIIMLLGVLLAGGLGVALLAAVFAAMGKQVIAAVIVAVIMGIAAVVGLIYLASWVQLAQVMAVVGKDIKEVFDCFKKSRPLVWPYVGFGLLSGLFMVGLFYTNILLFIPFLVWAVWGGFSIFAFLDGKRGGLMPMWYSKAKVKGSFFKVLLYVAVIYVGAFILSSLLAQGAANQNWVGPVLNGLIWFLFTPFILSYTYEIYKSLPEPKEVKRPTVWIALSVIGWVLYIAFFAFGIQAVSKNFQKSWNKGLEKKFERQFRDELKGQYFMDLKDIKLN